ncbi:MAG TPA: FecR domain-containing protein, partial [Methyloceanibacter sp.]|nr:FecR domain-containing protein [Methyloceanibacter sp.]
MTGKSLLRISATRLFVGVFLVLAIPGPVHAEKVGVAAAVNPDAFSSLAGAPQSQINIGKSIFYNERINTTGSGLVQVLLIDGSTFTVGPGSDLVIDRFVYDPKKGTGQITASFSKGVMRFVGGKLSKNDGGVTVNTPAGALAIRGGIAYVDFKSATQYAILFVFGEYLKMGGKTLFEPGFGWFVNNGVVETKKFSAADLKLILAALTNNNPNWGGDGNKSNNPASTFKLVNTQSLQQLIADANTQKIVDQANKVEPTPPPGGGGGCTVDCGGGGGEPTPIPINARVLTTPGVYTAFPGTSNQYTT